MNPIHTDKFVNNVISLRTAIPFTEKNLHVLHLLLNMRRSRSEKYPDRASFSTALSNAYAAGVGFNMNAYGPQLILDVRLVYIRAALVEEEGYVQAILDLLDQIVHHPLLDEEKLEESRFEVLSRLQTILENPDAAALLKAAELAAPGTTLSIPVQGTVEGFEAVTLKDIEDLWKQIHESPLAIYTAGNIEPEIENYLNDLPQKELKKLSHELLRPGEVRSEIVEREVDAISLTQIYADQTEPDADEYCALLVLNSMLGGCATNLLFQTIREQYSLCYSISSSMIRFEGALVITAQVLPGSLEKVQELIALQIRRLVDQDYDPSLLDHAKRALLDSLAEQQDSARAMIEQSFLNHYLSRDKSMEALKEMISQVSADQVSGLAEKLVLRSWCAVLNPSGAEETEEETEDAR